MEKKYLHILSFDGLSRVDMEKMKKLPAFSEFIKTASGCEKVKSIYPTLTYCAHTSIATGNYPDRHGVVNNTLLQINRQKPDWYWYDKYIKTPTFQRLANENGYDILSIFWPVTAGARHIKYNMPEIFANRWWDNQILCSLRNGTPYFQYKLNKLFGNLRNGFYEPELDDFTHASFLYSLDHFVADINMLHYIDLDSQRHDYGFDSKEANDALVRLDNRLGDIIKKLKDKGIYDNSVIVVLGDHSSKDGNQTISPNTLLKNSGLIDVDSNGKIVSHRAIAKSADGSCYIYSDEGVSDSEILESLKPILDTNAVERVYTSEEAAKMGADSSCRFMLEASLGYFFTSDILDKEIVDRDYLKKRGLKAYKNNHGYSPYTKEGYETVFFVSGCGIKKNVFVDEMSLVDEGPTFAKIMGFEMKDTDGRVMTEFLEG